MKVYPISNTNQASSKGCIDKKTSDLFRDISGAWFDKAGEMKTMPLINTCLFSSERVNNTFINISKMMERFCHACQLKFVKSKKNNIHRFYIENEYSNYKKICGDIGFSPFKNKFDDINRLEVLEDNISKINPYQENSNFILQRKSDAKGILFDKEFEPDADFLFLEDELVGKEPKKQATMKDIKDFIEAATEEGLING